MALSGNLENNWKMFIRNFGNYSKANRFNKEPDNTCLLRRVSSKKVEGHKYKKELPELFLGIGILQNIYQIGLKQSAQTMPVATP